MPLVIEQVYVTVPGDLAVAVTFVVIVAGVAIIALHAPATVCAVSEAAVAPSAISTIQLLVAAFACILHELFADLMV